LGAPNAKNAISTPATQTKRPIKARGLKKADRAVDFFFKRYSLAQAAPLVEAIEARRHYFFIFA
jgi:hypothetical protein